MVSIRLLAVVLVSLSILVSARVHAADSADCAGVVLDENDVPIAAAKITLQNSSGQTFSSETDAAGRSGWRLPGRSAQRRFLRTLWPNGHAAPRTQRHPFNAKARGRIARTSAGYCCREPDRYARYCAARNDNRARNPRHPRSQLTYFAAEPDGDATGRTR